MTRTQVLWAWAGQRWRRFRTREALDRHQAARVRRLLEEVRPRSPFYRERLAGNGLETLRAMPPIDKSVMMAEFDRLNTRGIRLEDALQVALAAEESRDFRSTIDGLTVGLSSGTSGSRGVFLVSDAERAAWAGSILARLLPGGGPGWRAHRIAFFLRANSNLYESLGSRRLRFEYFDLLEPLDSQVPQLRELAPTVVVGPPSLLVQLAAAQERGTLALRPERMVSVAEVLDPLDEARIRRAFGRTVHQVYQATEGLLGTTCAYGTLHLCEDTVLFDREYVSGETRRFVPIVTDLYRTTQPIIRYRLDDVLVEREVPCLCGSVMVGLERVEGRSDDVFVVRGHDGRVRPLYPDFVRRAVITSSDMIRSYRVRQTGFREIEIFVEGDGDSAHLRDGVRASLTGLFERLGSPFPEIVFVDAMAVQPGRKLRRVERAFQPAPGDLPEGLRR